MWNFLIIMGILLVIDIAYLGFWTGVYPFSRIVLPNDVSTHMHHLSLVAGFVKITVEYGF